MVWCPPEMGQLELARVCVTQISYDLLIAAW